MSEGGFFPLGTRNSIANDYSGVQIGTTKNVVLALKIKTGDQYKNGLVKPININLGFKSGNNSNNNEIMRFEVQLHSTNGNVGTIGGGTGPISYTSLSNTIVQYNTLPTGYTITNDGYKITSGFVNANSSIDFASTDYDTLLTRASITQYDTLVITAQTSSTGTSYAYAAVDFIESL
jgi:hypothetical protein